MAAEPFQLYSALMSKKPLPSEPSLRADIEHVLQHGYIVLPNSFSRAAAVEAKAEIGRLLGDGDTSSALVGRNAFEGLATNRVYSLLNKSRVFDKFTILPRVLALNEYFLDAGFLLSACHTISINPGERAQMLHHDDGYIQVPRPRAPFSTAIIVALDDFTATNGATRIIPGSHLWGSERRGTPAETIPALCPQGGVVYFVGTLWHGGGGNASPSVRQSLTVQYCQPFIRPIENQFLAVDPRRLDRMDERIVELMGYRVMQPFMGYADGLNPRRAAKRMVRWLRDDVVSEEDVPAFAHEEKDAEAKSKL